jgi:uncharacterized delta-60 repeat protein
MARFSCFFVLVLASAYLRGQALVTPLISSGSAWTLGALQPDGKILTSGAALRYNADGTVDTTYQYGGPPGQGAAVAVGPQGTIYAVVQGALVVLSANGSPDASANAALGQFAGAQLVMLASGKILAWSTEGNLTIGTQIAAMFRLNADGSFDSSFNIGAGPMNGNLYAVAELPNGQLLVGGYFSTFDNIATGSLTRLNLNGTVDSTFAPALIGEPPGPFLPLPNGNILAWDGRSRVLYLLDSTGSNAQSLGAVLGSDADIYTMALQPNGQALVAGGFYSIGGVSAYNLARLNEDGTLDPSFNPAPALANAQVSSVWTLAVQANGQILYGEQQGAMAGRLNSDGSVDPTRFGTATVPPRVLGVGASSDGRTFVVGEFTSVDGAPRMSVAALLPNGTLDPSFAPSAGIVWADAANVTPAAQISVAGDGSVYVTGTLLGAGNLVTPGIARYLPDGTLDANFAPTLNSGGAFTAVTTMPDGRIVAGGTFSSLNGQSRGNLAAFDTGGLLDGTFASGGGTNAAVQWLAPCSTGGCFLGGAFTLLQGVRSEYVAAMNASGTVNAAFSSVALSVAPVGIAEAPNGEVVVSSGSQVVRLNGSGAIDFTYTLPDLLHSANTTNFSDTVQALACDSVGNILVAVSEYTMFIGAELSDGSFVLRLNSSGNVVSGFPLLTQGGGGGTFKYLAALADGQAIVGGFFTDLGGGAPASGLAITTSSGAWLANLSSMSIAPTFTVGFSLAGSAPKTLLLRGVGPGLAEFGVPDPLSTPLLTWYESGGSVLQQVSGWNPALAATMMSVGAFALQLGSADAALAPEVNPGTYTLQIGSSNGGSGQALAEIYDTNGGRSANRLVNLSSGDMAGGSVGALTAGFVIGGTTNETLLLRGIGPQLAVSFGITGALANPVLTLYDGSGNVIAENNGWNQVLARGNSTAMAGTQMATAGEMAAVGAFPLAPNSADAAMLVSLPPGNYTLQISSPNGPAGEVLAEIYEMP